MPKGADESQIKRAYRKLALQMHPDKIQGSEDEKKKAADRFAEVTHAYEILTDAEKRRVYDRYGEEGLNQMGQGGGRGPQDIFSQFFGGGFGFENEEQTPRGHDVRVELEVSLKDIYLGSQFRIIRDKNVIRPAPGTRKCNCKNKVVTQQVGPGMYQQYTSRVCEDCPNLKYERSSEALTVSVDPGTPDMHDIQIFEEGEPLIDGEPGDLFIVVRTMPDAFGFVRDGDNLMLKYAISLLDALIGFRQEIEHLDGHKVVIESQEVTRPGEIKIIRGEGMPRFENAGKGDLHITFTVLFPKTLSANVKKQLEKVFDKAEWSRHEEL